IPWHLTGDGDVAVARCFTASGPDAINVSYVFRNTQGGFHKRFDLTVPPTGERTCFPDVPLEMETLPSDPLVAMFNRVNADFSLGLEYTADSPVGDFGAGPVLPANGHTMSYTRYCRFGACGTPVPAGSNYTINDLFASWPIPAKDIVNDWPFPSV